MDLIKKSLPKQNTIPINLEALTARKKVQAMRLYPPSNLPISGLKFIEKQIFELLLFLN